MHGRCDQRLKVVLVYTQQLKLLPKHYMHEHTCTHTHTHTITHTFTLEVMLSSFTFPISILHRFVSVHIMHRSTSTGKTQHLGHTIKNNIPFPWRCIAVHLKIMSVLMLVWFTPSYMLCWRHVHVCMPSTRSAEEWAVHTPSTAKHHVQVVCTHTIHLHKFKNTLKYLNFITKIRQ